MHQKTASGIKKIANQLRALRKLAGFSPEFGAERRLIHDVNRAYEENKAAAERLKGLKGALRYMNPANIFGADAEQNRKDIGEDEAKANTGIRLLGHVAETYPRDPSKPYDKTLRKKLNTPYINTMYSINAAEPPRDPAKMPERTYWDDVKDLFTPGRSIFSSKK